METSEYEKRIWRTMIRIKYDEEANKLRLVTGDEEQELSGLSSEEEDVLQAV